MKKIIDGIIVVEGTNDASFVSSLYDAEFVELNGLELKNIKYLIKASQFKKVYLLTDSDEEGKRIREKVKSKIPQCIDVIVDINKCDNNGKHGVFECEIGEIQRAFSNFVVNSPENLQNSDVKEISTKIKTYSNPKGLRKYVCDQLDIEICNNKTLLTRLTTLNIKVEDINRMIKEFENGN